MIPDSVVFTEDISGRISAFLDQSSYSKVAVLVDEQTEQYCLPLIVDQLPEHWLVKITSGEENKNLTTCSMIWEALTEAEFDRNALLINLGGGVIGDMGGFCAATFKRGIDFINLPTTLLSQVDASVGGKLGIDFLGLKNHIGAFKDPKGVFISTQFLGTLPHEEMRSGFAEVLKHALIADVEYWKKLTSSAFEEQEWGKHIEHSVGVKSDIVMSDPFEKGNRKLLNFGHTIGHAIESTYLGTDQRLLHGEAIAMGMICEGFLSTKKAGLTNEALVELAEYLLIVYGWNKIEKEDFDHIVSLCIQDKKNLNNVINCTMLSEIGKGIVNVPISTGEVLDSLFYYNQLNK